MATRYVRKSGSDSNGGTSPSDAWLTLGKALGASGISSGDTVWVGAGTYREVVTVAMTAATVETFVNADTDGSHTGDPGRVTWTAYLTDEKTAPSTSPLLSLGSKHFLTFQGLYMVGGSSATAGIVDGFTGSPNHITFRRCVFWPGAASNHEIRAQAVAGTAMNWTLDSCVILGQNNAMCVSISAPTVTGADYDIVYTVVNCLFITPRATAVCNLATTAALANKPGGFLLQNCTVIGGDSSSVATTSANWSTSIPAHVYNCYLFGGNTTLNANTLGQIVEDYNLMQGVTPRTAVSSGANSQVGYTYCGLLDMFYGVLNGLAPHVMSEPSALSALLNFGNTGAVTAVTTDLMNRPRPSGGVLNAIGASERHDLGQRSTTQVDSGTYSVAITNAGDQDFQVPVDAVSTTISVRVRYDTNHAATNKPQITLVANPEIGVVTETKTATVGVDTWETLTFTAFTPTATGFVTVRLISRSAAATGVAYFDTSGVPAIDTSGMEYYRRLEPFPALVSKSSSGPVGAGRLTGGLQ